eukprot:GEMP01011209.1.p2 GENE.GEMP01011209.1~~GEMP01011209.1.p2  ORF type:complete len:441 (+),score=36.58 GEMP01011209.1:1576-2898(+)
MMLPEAPPGVRIPETIVGILKQRGINGMEEDEGSTSTESEHDIGYLDYSFKGKGTKPIAKAYQSNHPKYRQNMNKEPDPDDLSDAMKNIGADRMKSLQEIIQESEIQPGKNGKKPEGNKEKDRRMSEILEIEYWKERERTFRKRKENRKEKTGTEPAEIDPLINNTSNENQTKQAFGIEPGISETLSLELEDGESLNEDEMGTQEVIDKNVNPESEGRPEFYIEFTEQQRDDQGECIHGIILDTGFNGTALCSINWMIRYEEHLKKKYGGSRFERSRTETVRQIYIFSEGKQELSTETAMIPIWIGNEWISVMTRLIPGDLKMLIGSLFMKCTKMKINTGTWEIQYKKGEKYKIRMDKYGHYILSTPEENHKIPAEMTKVREIVQIVQIRNRIVKTEMQYKIEKPDAGNEESEEKKSDQEQESEEVKEKEKKHKQKLVLK